MIPFCFVCKIQLSESYVPWLEVLNMISLRCLFPYFAHAAFGVFFFICLVAFTSFCSSGFGEGKFYKVEYHHLTYVLLTKNAIKSKYI